MPGVVSSAVYSTSVAAGLLRFKCLLLAVALVMGAVVSKAAPLAQNENFLVVRLQPGEDFADLARIWLGDARQSWQIRELNANLTEAAGQLVAIPRKPVNPSSVYPDGYRVLPILCYHQFTSADTASHALELTAKAFEQQIDYLVSNHFQILSFSDVEKIVNEGQPIPEQAVVISIDDGYRSVFDVAWPILKKYSVPATLFIYTDFIGGSKALGWEQMQEMLGTGLIEIQSHGKSHTSLARIPKDKTAAIYTARIEAEITGSDRAFKRYLGQSPQYLSYPYGNSSKTAIKLYREAGYELAATVSRGDNTAFSDPYLLHRTMIYADHDLADFANFVRSFRSRKLR